MTVGLRPSLLPAERSIRTDVIYGAVSTGRACRAAAGLDAIPGQISEWAELRTPPLAN